MSGRLLRWTLAVVSLVAFLSAAWLFYRVARLAAEVDQYVEVAGEVLTSGLEAVDEAADLWRPVVTVRYRVGDLEYTSSSEATLRKRPRAEADAWLAAHPAGSAIEVFHAPGEPASARLTRDVSMMQAVVAFFVTLIACVLTIAWAVRAPGARIVETKRRVT